MIAGDQKSTLSLFATVFDVLFEEVDYKSEVL